MCNIIIDSLGEKPQYTWIKEDNLRLNQITDAQQFIIENQTKEIKQLKKALRKCTPIRNKGSMMVCAFCNGCQKHADDCEYVRLTGGCGMTRFEKIKEMTKFKKIKEMTIEEMAKWIGTIKDKCDCCLYKDNFFCGDCTRSTKEWLESEDDDE